MPNPTLAERLRKLLLASAVVFAIPDDSVRQHIQEKVRALADEVEALEAFRAETIRAGNDSDETYGEALDRIKALEAELRKIESEETGYEFRCDPLEYARSVIEEMREIAREALTETGGGE